MPRVIPMSSLRGRLLTLVVVALLPCMAVVAWAEWNTRRLLLDRVQGEARDLARLVAERHQRLVDRSRGILVGLSRLESLRRLDGPGCSADLARLLAETPLYANVGGVKPDGDMFCSGTPLTRPLSLADRFHVRGALDRGSFTVGGYILSRTRGIGSFVFGHPVRDGSGKVVAAAVFSFDLTEMQRELDALALPGDVEAVVVDANGTVVTGIPAPGARVGRPLEPRLLAPMTSNAGLTELEGLDGVRRIYAFQEVDGSRGTIAMRVGAGIPVGSAYAPVDRIVWNSALAFLALTLLAMLAAAAVAEKLVVRPLAATIRAARRIAAGDHSARTGLAPGADEVGELVRAFDEMAGSLESLWRRHRLLLDAVGDGIVGIDREGRITFANPVACREMGWSAEEMLGKGSHGLFHARRADGSLLPEAECNILSAMRDGAARKATDEVLWRRDGSSFPIDYVSTPIVDAGRVVGAVVVFKDVSERRRLEDRLRQAEKMEAVGRLAGGIAHDFNNLLTAIVACAQLIRDELSPDHASQGDLREIEFAAGRATALTRQLLTFGSRQRITPRLVELRGVVRGMESMLRRLLPESVALRVEAPVAGTVLADQAQLELAVLNLAVNARDAMPNGGRIDLSVAELEEGAAEDDGLPGGPLALLEVRDQGEGMDEATTLRIFEPFFTTKVAGKGTGLGLSSVYGIVAQSGGAIRVSSEPGKGSEFRVYLPLRKSTSPADAPGEPAAAAPARPGVETILLVEDDGPIRDVARRVLAGAGYHVLEAGTPGDALQIALHGPSRIDLLVSDVILPEMNGWALSQEVRRARPGLPALFTSGYAAQPSGEPLLPAGVPFLPKPFGPEELLRAVREVLDGPPTGEGQGAGTETAAVSAPKRSA